MQNEVTKNLNMNANVDNIIDNNENHTIDGNVSNKAKNIDVNGGEPTTYANMVKKDEVLINKNLIFIAPKITDDGGVKVLFDEEIDPEIGMEKLKHKTLPIWVKLVNIPIEGWSMEGINALASSLGKPNIMDAITTYMCQFGVGRTDYARVLVEIKAKKDAIKIEYC
ncbi:zinc knuckle CX2CX4HX4C containing protein [Tanacetum coccineum]